MASSAPSGDHSASRMFSISTRGALPSIDVRASVPMPIQPSKVWPSEIAISPLFEMDSRRASGSERRTDSWLSVRVMKIAADRRSTPRRRSPTGRRA